MERQSPGGYSSRADAVSGVVLAIASAECCRAMRRFIPGPRLAERVRMLDRDPVRRRFDSLAPWPRSV